MKKLFYLLVALLVTINSFAYDFQVDNLYYEIIGIFDADLSKKECYNTFTTISVTGDEEWNYSNSYGARMSGYKYTQTYPNEDWLISPALDLTGKTSVKLRFFHTFGRPLPSSEDEKAQYSLWISNDFVDRVENATWTELKGMTYATKAWEYIWSEDIYIPQEFLTKNCRIAWKYSCVDECATWEIKNISIVDMSPHSSAVAVVPADYSKLIHIEIPDSIEYNDIVYQVKQIKNNSFANCSSLLSIRIPQNIDSIGSSILLSCDSLQSIVVDSNNKTYDSRENCNAIIKTKSNVLIQGCNRSKIPTTVTELGKKAFYNCKYIDSIVIPSSVITIGEYAFQGCRSLRKIDISKNVTSIGNYAFSSCYKLKSISLPSNLTQLSDGIFHWCDSLSEIYIPDNITKIYSRAFYECYSLKSINIPSTMVSIDHDAFEGCYFLSDKFINHSTLNAKDNNYWGAIIGDEEYEGLIIQDKIVIGCRRNVISANIPNHIVKIKTKAFNQCTKLISVFIPTSVIDIEKEAFVSCHSLSNLKVDDGNTIYDSRNNCNAIIESFSNKLILGCMNTIIPDNVTIIGSKSFSSCRKLSSILLPNSITTIEDSAFHECIELDSITIPLNTTIIGQSAFSLCKSLQYVLWNAKKCNDFLNQYYSPFVYEVFDAERNNHIKSFVFGDDVEYIPAYLCYGMNNLTTLTIPKNIKSIGEKAFVGCTSLSSIVWNAKNCQDCLSISPFNDSKNIISSFTFGNNVEHIPALLCSDMNSLSSIEIPNSVTSIGYGAFSDCQKLGTLVLGDKVKEIGNYAFNGCNKLYHIYFYAPEPPAIEENVFTNYNVNLYVPCNYLDNYKYDRVFGSFRYIQCIESEDVTTDDVVVTPGTNDVTITWPIEGNADTYTIVIKKGDEVFCTLTFNANGQLLNIAFAPGRDGNHPAQYAEQAGNGYRFTVTNLESGTHYTYNIDVRDATNKTIKSHSGEFTTKSMTSIEDIEVSGNAKTQQILRDGQLLILHDGKTFNVMGQEL